MSKNIPQEWTGQVGKYVVKWRWIFLILSLTIAGVVGYGSSKIAFKNDYRVFFSDENPQLQAFEELQRTYTKVDNIMFAVVPNSGNSFDAKTLAAVEELTAEAWKLPFVLRADAITNFQHTIAEEDDLIVADLVEGAASFTAEQLAAARAVALSEPSLLNRLVAEDGEVTGVNVTFQMPEKSMDEIPIAVAAARELVKNIEEKHDVDIRMTGMIMMNNAFFESSINDMSSLIPLMYLAILLVTFLLTRSLTATIGTMIVLFLSILTAMGAAGWLGINLTPPSASAPTIIMTLAVADSIHILITMLGLMKIGKSKQDAIFESIRINMVPVILTSVTTAIGFLSLNFSDSPPFRDLGNITSIGVMAALFYSVVFLVPFLSIFPVKTKMGEDRIKSKMEKFGKFVTNNRHKVLISSSIFAVVLISLIPLNELNDDFIGYFDESITFRADVDFTTKELTGIYQLQYSLNSGESNGVSDPKFLSEADRFVTWLRSQEEVTHVASITDVFKRLNKNLHGDNEEYYKLPENRELAAQYLLLYELSLPYGLDLNNQLNIDKSSTQIIATLDNMKTQELLKVTKRGEKWLDDNTTLSATGIGPSIMFAYLSERNINSMLLGTFFAVVLISGILLFALRSVKIGLISLIPNLIPAAMAFGFWAIFEGEVNMAVSMVTGMTLGIVVDDTVHFLSKYMRARREKHLDTIPAIHYAFSSVGSAILVTSIVLIAGFFVLAQSTFAMNSQMASLTAIAVGFALIADFLILPTLLIIIDRKKYKTGKVDSKQSSISSMKTN